MEKNLSGEYHIDFEIKTVFPRVCSFSSLPQFS